jgi:hypothetical protein
MALYCPSHRFTPLKVIILDIPVNCIAFSLPPTIDEEEAFSIMFAHQAQINP